MLDIQVNRQRVELKEEEKCVQCSETAEIFQVMGDYCLRCWQAETNPNV